MQLLEHVFIFHPEYLPHAVKVSDGIITARMLMTFQSAGFEGLLTELAKMCKTDLADETVIAALHDKHDIVQLGPLPEKPS